MDVMGDAVEPKKKRQRFTLPDGYECRGFKFKIYPTEEQEKALAVTQAQCRYIWNAMISDSESTMFAREAWAVRNGHVPAYSKDILRLLGRPRCERRSQYPS